LFIHALLKFSFTFLLGIATVTCKSLTAFLG
jgi:hypothetical protein